MDTLFCTDNEFFINGEFCESIKYGDNITIKPSDIKLIAYDYYNCMIYTHKYELFYIGDNFNDGQRHGLNKIKLDKYRLLMIDKDIKQICCGEYQCLILKTNGDLYIFSSNRFQELGIGYTKDNIIYDPTLIMSDPNINSIHCGHRYSLILKNTGELWVFGNNSYGYLGINPRNYYDSQDIPIRFDFEILNPHFEIKMISTCKRHSLIYIFNKELKRNELWGFGYNEFGQLGIGNTSKTCSSPIYDR